MTTGIFDKVLFVLVAGVAVYATVKGVVSGLTRTVQEKRERKLLNDLKQELVGGVHAGRKWLANYIADADKAGDELIASDLSKRWRPALKAAEQVSKALAERREWKERAKFLEYQLASYKEYFPFLEEYEEIILDEAIPLGGRADSREALESSDPVLLYVPKVDFEKLSPAERNQIALDKYLNGTLSRAAIGRLYERYVGYLYEQKGWQVEYHGIIQGFEDMGRDLICAKGNQVKIIQAKCWSAEKTIHEKHIFQLFGTTQLYLMHHEEQGLPKIKVTAEFITTTKLSPVAKQAADRLNIDVKEQFAMDKGYPMIKCNINQASKEKIYHLPFDQQYDKTKIIKGTGEFYATTVAEAERKGFRRAFRHFVSS